MLIDVVLCKYLGLVDDGPAPDLDIALSPRVLCVECETFLFTGFKVNFKAQYLAVSIPHAGLLLSETSVIRLNTARELMRNPATLIQL